MFKNILFITTLFCLLNACEKEKEENQGNLNVYYPAVRLNNIGDPTNTECNCYGEVTFDGGAKIEEMGFCWNTNGNPTVNDNYVIIADESYKFTGIISPLIEKKYYFVRAFAKNKKGISYSSEEIKFAASLPIPIENNGTLYVYPWDNSNGIPWDNFYFWTTRDGVYIDVLGAKSKTDGLQNTKAIVAAYGNKGSEKNYAANLCSELYAYGKNDWYLPSIDELEAISNNLEEIGTFIINDSINNYYWSSTGKSEMWAYVYNLDKKYSNTGIKLNNNRVRCVRRD